jgi:hypothetical protein
LRRKLPEYLNAKIFSNLTVLIYFAERLANLLELLVE